MPRPATIEQIIPPAVQTQKAVLIAALESHKKNISALQDSIRDAQTMEELLANMRTAADKMM